MIIRWLVRPLTDGHGSDINVITLTLVSYVRVYVSQIILVVVLSAVTIFRREMSCNRVFHKQQDNDTAPTSIKASASPTRHVDLERREQWADDLLEGAGKWGSGRPLIELLRCVWASVAKSKERVRRVPKTERWTDQMSEELLEGAGLSLSGEPFWSAIISLWTRMWLTSLADFHGRHVTARPSALSNELSTDLLLHVFSFLHPKDITTFACCNKECNAMVHSEENVICQHLWKVLWFRDYAWLVQSWEVGVEARKRSRCKDRPLDEQLYFEFGQTYINYLIAGHNSIHDCLVGLHGNIYDITAFLDIHPGSPETIQIHAGREATRHFEDIAHSMAARRRAMALCAVVDLSCHDEHGFGVRKASEVRDSLRTIPFSRYPRRPATLLRIRKHLENGERQARRDFLYVLPLTILQEVNVYYDAFDRKWKAWSIDAMLNNQFLSD